MILHGTICYKDLGQICVEKVVVIVRCMRFLLHEFGAAFKSISKVFH